MRIASQKVIDSAQGAACSVRFPGICNGDPETTVWCHLNGTRFGKGAGIKSHDVAGFAGCSSCHHYYDVGHGTKPLISTDTLLECVLGAVVESYVRLIVAEIIKVPQDKVMPSHQRPTKPRKPKAEWAKITSNPKIQSRPMRRKEITR